MIRQPTDESLESMVRHLRAFLSFVSTTATIAAFTGATFWVVSMLLLIAERHFSQ